jgi:type IV pilus assembly protein PilQ
MFEKGKIMINRKLQKSLSFLLSVALFLIITMPLFAQNDKGKTEVLSGVQLKLQKRVSVDFKDTPIDDVIKVFAEQAGIDVIKSPEVVGTVTAKLTDIPLQEALDNILAAHGYGYVPSESMIRIVPISQITEKTEQLVSKIYRITYADVSEVEKSLKKFISQQGSLSSNPGTSNIIVTDTESKIKAIDTFIEEIDRMTPQILVETRIYDITSKDRFDLGIEWEAGRRTTYGVTGVTDVGPDPSGGIKPFSTGVFDSTISKTEDTSAALRFGWLDSHVDIDAMLRAEKENIDAKLLANPRILVLDNQQAVIKIVSQIPYQQITQGGGNTLPIGTTEFKDVGVTLTVIPHVTRDGMVRLQLKPEFSVQTDEVTLSGQFTSAQPVVDLREATTTLLIKDGQTVVLGGLRKKDATKQMNKIPLLGDIPIIGLLFRFKGEETTTSELVVFVTPRIIPDPTMNDVEKQQYEHTEFDGPVPLVNESEQIKK